MRAVPVLLSDEYFKALAHPVRRRILEILAERGRGQPIRDFVSQFAISQPAVSQHLAKLIRARLVYFTKHREERLYRLDPQAAETLEQWAAKLKNGSTERMTASDTRAVAYARRNAGRPRQA